MSPLNVYGLTDAAADGTPRGALGEPVISIRAGRLFALAGDVAQPPELTPEALRAHEAAVRRLADACPAFLPARFGSVADELDLARREEELLQALELVRGREQMTLRVHGEPSGADRASGTAYLESLRRARAVPQIDPLRDALSPLLRAERTEPGRNALLASVYHLIDRGRSAEYLGILARTELAVRVVPSGPWPAWSFAPEALR